MGIIRSRRPLRAYDLHTGRTSGLLESVWERVVEISVHRIYDGSLSAIFPAMSVSAHALSSAHDHGNVQALLSLALDTFLCHLQLQNSRRFIRSRF